MQSNTLSLDQEIPVARMTAVDMPPKAPAERVELSGWENLLTMVLMFLGLVAGILLALTIGFGAGWISIC